MNRGERRALRTTARGYSSSPRTRASALRSRLILRRGERLLVVEVKEKRGSAFGDPLEMIDDEKVHRVHTAALGWLRSRPDLAGLEVAFEAAGVQGRRVERVPLT